MRNGSNSEIIQEAGEVLDFQEYLQYVRSQYGSCSYSEELHAEIFYEEQFELKWLASKLKMFSVVSFSERVEGNDIRQFSDSCCKFALNEYKGLPRGFQNGVVSFSVLASPSISSDATAFAVSRPPKHFAAFEMPILMDLSARQLYYYQKTPTWGAIYYPHFRNYIQHHFAVHPII